MSYRGRPLPWGVREAIQSLRRGGATIRHIAASVGVARDTAHKYARKVPREV